MDVEFLLGAAVQWLQAHVPYAGLILVALGALVVIGSSYVALSPSKSDDEWLKKVQDQPILGRILKFLAAFSPFQKK